LSRAAHTIGVAIGVPEPYGAELTKWREDLGDPLALAIPPHVTLITPTELDDSQLAAVVSHLEVVASQQWPFEIQLRGTGSFRPVSPVVFVALAAGISDCVRVESAVRSGPLAGPLKFDYHPHVTVAHDVPPEVLDHAFRELADYEAAFTVEHFGLFERGDDGVWRTDRDFAFGLGAPEGSTST
jgi:2'-5' RNA ligase